VNCDNYIHYRDKQNHGQGAAPRLRNNYRDNKYRNRFRPRIPDMTAIILQLPVRDPKAFPRGFYDAVATLSRPDRKPLAPYQAGAPAPRSPSPRTPPHMRRWGVGVEEALAAYAA
jgi:hypothetical protein